MPLTDKWLGSFLRSKLHQDAIAFNLMARSITRGGDASKQVVKLYAREAYGAYIVSNPSSKREECPEILQLDFDLIW